MMPVMKRSRSRKRLRSILVRVVMVAMMMINMLLMVFIRMIWIMEIITIITMTVILQLWHPALSKSIAAGWRDILL